MSKQVSQSVIEGDELLKKVRELLKHEGISSSNKVEIENEIESYLLPSLDKFREVQRFIYEPFLYDKEGVISKLKNQILNKIGNISRNVVERSIMRQQKYNDNVHILLMHLYKKNQELEERLKSLEVSTKDEN